jgi:F-type H+-transporting ATPase subunit epsilon
MQVIVAKVHENLYAGEAHSLTVPTTAGELTILPNHEPIVATLKAGTVVVRAPQGEHIFPVEGGVLEISNNQATVLL